MSGAETRPVVVLMGGRSGEREVSLASGAAVMQALESAGRTDLLAVEVGCDGCWRWNGGECDPAGALASLPVDAVFFLAVHGGEGEDGTLQGLLRACGRTHTGSGVAASALCMDKAAARAVLAQSGLAVAPGVLVSARSWRECGPAMLDHLLCLGADGWFVKPNGGGSSIGIRRVLDSAGLGAAVDAVLAEAGTVLVEALVEGREASCPVLGNTGSRARSLCPVEIVPREGSFFDYAEKYDERCGAQEIVPPTGLSPDTCSRLREMALRAHEATGCSGASRTDFIVPLEGPGAGDPVVLEVNTLPGLTPRSLLPKAAAVEGLGFDELCCELLTLAVAREGQQ
ncbi:MAG: D-alanine--D-alanine ligase [Planctomycetota bacterium]|nr:D-alanine--D-alanine ligase [Planctomycetota bacterium]